jgi:hypothetical protein
VAAAGQWFFETLGRRPRFFTVPRGKRVRGRRWKHRPGRCREPWTGKAQESRRLAQAFNAPGRARDSREGQSLETGASLAGASRVGVCTGTANGMQVRRRGDALTTLREGNALKGESQERCRSETNPARLEGRKPPRG